MRTTTPAPRSTPLPTAALLTGILFSVLGMPKAARAQQRTTQQVSLAIGAALGYVPTMTYGAEKSSGAAA